MLCYCVDVLEDDVLRSSQQEFDVCSSESAPMKHSGTTADSGPEDSSSDIPCHQSTVNLCSLATDES